MTRSLFLTKLMLKCKPNYKGIPELQPQKNYSSLPQLCTPSQKEEKINHEIQETGIQYRKEKKGILTIKAKQGPTVTTVLWQSQRVTFPDISRIITEYKVSERMPRVGKQLMDYLLAQLSTWQAVLRAFYRLSEWVNKSGHKIKEQEANFKNEAITNFRKKQQVLTTNEM